MPELFDFEFGSSWTYVLIALLTFSTRSKRRLFTVQLLSNYVVPYSCRSGLHLQFKSESVPHFRDACNTITDLLTSIWLLCSLFAVKLPIKKTFPVPSCNGSIYDSSWHFRLPYGLSWFLFQLRPVCSDYFSRVVPCAVSRFLPITSRCCINVTTH